MDTFVVALDIAGTFDWVWHRGLTAKLRSLGVHDDLLRLIQDFSKAGPYEWQPTATQPTCIPSTPVCPLEAYSHLYHGMSISEAQAYANDLHPCLFL